MAKEYMKKMTNKGAAIRHQMDRGMTNVQISKSLGVPESTIRYYRKRPKNLISKRSSKLPKKYIEEIYRLASNKTTREMPAGLIAIKINEKLKRNNERNKKGKLLSISKRQVNNILKEKYGKPLKIKKVFYLNEDSKKKRMEFCKKIVVMEIDGKKLEGKNIFFTDETRIDTAPNTSNESIRISSKVKNKIKLGDEEGYKMINRETKKFEPSIIVAGGVSYYGLSDLILLKGTMQEFSYAQALEYYNDNYENFKNINKNIFFEQDGAPSHTSKKVKKLLEELFGDKFIQNAPHSPDIAYPIETLWAELKKKVKERRAKNLDDLKQITIEEWNKIPQSFIKNLFKNFIKRCKKIIELNGGRLEPVHLQQIRKEAEKETKEEDEECEDDKNNKAKKLKLKIVYNKNDLIQKAKKEIAFIRKKIKAKKRELRKAKKEYNKTKKYSMKIGRKIEAVTYKESKKKIKNIELQNYNFRVNWIKKYISENIDEYFKYFKNECDKIEREETMASTLDGEINNMLKTKKEKKEFRRNKNFYTLEFKRKKK